jgi:hypothetical protein
MGGGVVASALADAGKKVLVLEAGSLLFPTHIGNLPRRLLIGQFQKHVWSLWEDFKVINYRNVPGSAYDGGQGFNLGGRSIFWGSFTPPLAAWELDAFPPVVRRYLLDPTPAGGYPLARRVFNADVPVPNRFPDYVGDHAEPAPSRAGVLKRHHSESNIQERRTDLFQPASSRPPTFSSRTN